MKNRRKKEKKIGKRTEEKRIKVEEGKGMKNRRRKKKEKGKGNEEQEKGRIKRRMGRELKKNELK